MKFAPAPIYDLCGIAQHASRLKSYLENWRVVANLPLIHWQDKADDLSDLNAFEQILRRRKELDVRKFSIPAKAALNDLNRCLASLGLGQLTIDSFIEKES